MNWAKMNGIKIREGVSVEEMPWRGLGITLSTPKSTKKGDVILEVPTQMALSVDVPRDSPTNSWISQLFENKKKILWEECLLGITVVGKTFPSTCCFEE